MFGIGKKYKKEKSCPFCVYAKVTVSGESYWLYLVKYKSGGFAWQNPTTPKRLILPSATLDSARTNLQTWAKVVGVHVRIYSK
jgi:hypothetical protein